MFAAISSQGLLILKDAYYGTLKAFAAGTWTYDALGNAMTTTEEGALYRSQIH